MSEGRVVHRFPPGEFTRVALVHVPHQDIDHLRSLCFELVNRPRFNGGVVLCRMTRPDIDRLVSDLMAELART